MSFFPPTLVQFSSLRFSSVFFYAVLCRSVLLSSAVMFCSLLVSCVLLCSCLFCAVPFAFILLEERPHLWKLPIYWFPRLVCEKCFSQNAAFFSIVPATMKPDSVTMPYLTRCHSIWQMPTPFALSALTASDLNPPPCTHTRKNETGSARPGR